MGMDPSTRGAGTIPSLMAAERLRRAWPTLACAAAVLAVSRMPGLVSLIPSLGVWNGPLGLALALLAAGVGVSLALPGGEAAPPSAAPAPRPPSALTFFLAGAAILLAVGLRHAAGVRVSGDEPHYLLMAQSLWREGDLDLQDNLAREDWREYTPGPVAPHHGAPRADGRPFPAHSPGLPLLLAPVYGAGGRLACVALLSLCAAGASSLAYALALRATGSVPAAILGGLAALGPPLMFYGFHVYTEAPSALLAAGSLWLLLGASAAPGPRLVREVSRGAAAALLASLLPWLHVKMIPGALALALTAAIVLRGRARVVFFAVAAAMGIAFLLYFQAIFGVASPLAIYGGLPVGERGSPVRALIGLLLDRSFGLLPHAPIFLVALAGLPLLRGRHGWPLALLGAAVLLPALGWRMWWAGQSPPARFLVPLVPVLAVALALRVARSPRGLARWALPLCVASLALGVFMAFDPGALLLVNRGPRPTRLWAALSGATAVGGYLPSLVARDAQDLRVAALWLGAGALVLALDAMALRRDAVERCFRGLVLPLGLLLTIGLLVDVWVRPTDAVVPDAPYAGDSGSGPR
jgi:hypothetical protein